MAKKRTSNDTVLELGRTNIPVIGHEVIVYDHWDGPVGDPASKQTRRMAMFNPDDEKPDDIQEWIDAEEHLDAWSDPYRNQRSSRYYSYRSDFNGLWGASFDESLEVIKERDEDAERFRRDMEREMAPVSIYGQEDAKAEAERFFEAVDLIATDRENTDAWKIIDAYRNRQLQRSESGAKQL